MTPDFKETISRAVKNLTGFGIQLAPLLIWFCFSGYAKIYGHSRQDYSDGEAIHDQLHEFSVVGPNGGQNYQSIRTDHHCPDCDV